MCVCVCVCVREREREREGEGGGRVMWLPRKPNPPVTRHTPRVGGAFICFTVSV